VTRSSRLWREIRATTAVAAPLAGATLAQMAMGFTDTVMVGRLGAVPLAAAGLGATLYFTAGVALQAIVSAVAPLAAHAVGRGDPASAGRIAGEGLIVAVLLAVPFMLGLTFFDRLLVVLGYEAALAAQVGRFLHAIVWGAPAFMAFAALRSLLAALSRTRPIVAVLLFCIPANAFLNWALIYGHVGVPSLGVAGSGYASAIIQWLMFLGLALYVECMPEVRALRVFRNIASRDWSELGHIVRLGAPIGGMVALENGVFLTAGVLVGLFGAAALGANQIVLNCAAFTFMVPLGIGQAATVRVAFEVGAGNPAGARRAAFVALAMGVTFMAAAAVVLWTVPRLIIAVYIDTSDPANRETVEIALRLMIVAALFQIFDGIQTVAAGALRGYKDAAVPMLYAAIGYWGIGFVGGCLLAFPGGLGPVGLWWGLALGLAVVAALLTARLQRLSSSTEAIRVADVAH
jgi:multidrug resistance protein, MATE family